MLSVFLVIGLALLLAAVSSLVRGSSRPLSSDATTTPASIGIPDTADATDQLVLLVGPPAPDVLQVCTAFRALYKNISPVAYPFQLHAVEPGITALTFPQNLPADFFYYLVNYLSYPEAGYSVPAKVQGWATLPIVTRDNVVAPPEPVLVCVPRDDTEYDVVLLVTPAPAIYQVSFQNLLPITLRYAVPVAYVAPPYSLDRVRLLPVTATL